ncbi:MAG TPA: hypothetical protein VFY22_10600 [Hydrogenophaga sp.]|nr:hypothetical protein [Hydrogenophaga sp.]
MNSCASTFLALMATAAMLLSGCGLETAGTAATAGATKQIELEQARKTQEEVRQQVQQSMDEINKRNQQLDGATQ